jgi:hypothetical protein
VHVRVRGAQLVPAAQLESIKEQFIGLKKLCRVRTLKAIKQTHLASLDDLLGRLAASRGSLQQELAGMTVRGEPGARPGAMGTCTVCCTTGCKLPVVAVAQGNTEFPWHAMSAGEPGPAEALLRGQGRAHSRDKPALRRGSGRAAGGRCGCPAMYGRTWFHGGQQR